MGVESDGGCVRQFPHEAVGHRVGLRSLIACSRLKAATQFVFFLPKGSGEDYVPGDAKLPLAEPLVGKRIREVFSYRLAERLMEGVERCSKEGGAHQL